MKKRTKEIVHLFLFYIISFFLDFPLKFECIVSFLNGEWWTVNDDYKGDNDNTKDDVNKSEAIVFLPRMTTKKNQNDFVQFYFELMTSTTKQVFFSCCLKHQRGWRLLQLRVVEVISCRWGLFYPCSLRVICSFFNCACVCVFLMCKDYLFILLLCWFRVSVSLI